METETLQRTKRQKSNQEDYTIVKSPDFTIPKHNTVVELKSNIKQNAAKNRYHKTSENQPNKSSIPIGRSTRPGKKPNYLLIK